MSRTRRFTAYAWGVLGYLLVVVLWGAYVRATGSGAGCGAHWPLCNGVVLPRSPGVATMIEFSHRLSSGLLLLAAVGLVLGARRAFPAGHRVRRAAAASLGLTVLEALIGAGLVLFELVADDPSTARGFSMAAHLVNTYFLIGAVLLTAWWASGAPAITARGRERLAALFGLGVAGMLVLGMSGAIAALGDTLFPARSLAEGLRQDFDPAGHVFLRLRIAHPAIAVAVALYTALLVGLAARARATRDVRSIGRGLAALLAIQLVAGLLNVALLAPVWLQLAHLLLADLVWIALLLLAASTFAAPDDREDAMTRAPTPAGTERQPEPRSLARAGGPSPAAGGPGAGGQSRAGVRAPAGDGRTA